jgi:ATP-dependent helicase HrpA
MSESARLTELQRLLPQGLLRDQLRIGRRLAHWLRQHPRTPPVPALLGRWLAEARASVAERQRRQASRLTLRYPPELPITARRDAIVAAIRQQPVLVVAGETGSGKTTQLPKMCLEAGLGIRAQIGCTQPRRVAAVSLSRRLAEEVGREWGEAIGCKIRFADRTRPETLVKFMTDGVLLAEAQGDPWLSDYEAILLDEAHERSLNIDFLLGLLRSLLEKRHDLKLIITSATIDTQAFARHFHDAPILAVSGRSYPVQVRYAPFGSESDGERDLTYVDAAVRAVDEILEEPMGGDILVFMPSERDILETRDALEQRHGAAVELVPLFGRLSAEEQQRVFVPSARRRVVIATNIAETSITVPRVRYVVDTGLARLSRYHARTRTKRLPIEPISQSSARQRAGRCGRVGEGICIRLYSAADFAARPPYTPPEILRADLAEVILRMKAYGLGEIETFPFLDPPPTSAIQSGYRLLQELGALDEGRGLTDLGERLAQLPLDPAIGRMILEASREGALREVLIIAAGLSIQDPRERPADRQAAASTAHRRFQHPASDFLTLLNIWEASHDTWESLKTQNQMRRFCRAHFLSYPRMREWRDIHALLEEVLAEMGGFMPNQVAASYAAIHRSILTGLWGHVASRKEGNRYALGGNREALVFPGSGLFERPVAPRRGQGAEPVKPTSASRDGPPPWVVAGEIVETSRLFLRTVAGIDPRWIEELAPHLCQRAYSEPHWEPRSGRVLARERVTLNGLLVREGLLSYGRVDPQQATAIFIQSALVEEGLADHFLPRSAAQPPATEASPPGPPEPCDAPHDTPRHRRPRPPAAGLPAAAATGRGHLEFLPAPYRFLLHNRQLRQKLQLWQTRQAERVVADLDPALAACYARHLTAVSSVPDLHRLLREQQARDPRFLHLTEADLLGPRAADFDAQAFPDALTVGHQALPVRYAYAPGEEHDGVTFRLPLLLTQVLESDRLDWAVPGLREAQILHLLQALPKELRRPLMPLAPKAQEMARAVEAQGGAFLQTLIDFIHRRYGVALPRAVWDRSLLPEHLRPRYEILGPDARTIASGRDLPALREQVARDHRPTDSPAWSQAARQWERYGLRAWDLGDLPDQITVGNVAGLPWHAFPALQAEEGEISLRLFRRPTEAEAAHRQAVPRLVETVLHREFAWLQKDLRGLAKWRELHAGLGPVEELEATAFEHLRRHLLAPRDAWPRTARAFADLVQGVRAQLPGLAIQLVDRTGQILEARQKILLCRKPYAGMPDDLRELIPPQFLRHIPFDRLPQIPRYLKAMLVRAERAAVHPAKDQEKLRRVQPYVEALAHVRASGAAAPGVGREKLEACRWLLEEYKVSVFAQELGTAEPVSPRRLAAALQALAPELGEGSAAKTPRRSDTL